MTSCADVMHKMEKLFDSKVHEALINDEPAEHGVSETEFVTNYRFIEDILSETVDEVVEEALEACNLDREDRYWLEDNVEAHWQRNIHNDKYGNLSEVVKPV